jgi:hypothetical protein
MKLNIIKRSAPESGSAASRESHHQTFGMMVILNRTGSPSCTRKISGPYLVFRANGQRSPTATCEMMPRPRKLSAAVVIQSSGVALVQVTPLA